MILRFSQLSFFGNSCEALGDGARDLPRANGGAPRGTGAGRFVDPGTCGGEAGAVDCGGGAERLLVGRCRLTVSKPVLHAPMVSALETIIS